MIVIQRNVHMNTNGKLLIFGIVLNIFAGIGAFLFGFLDDYIGGKKTIQITNIGFIISILIAFSAPELNNGEVHKSDYEKLRKLKKTLTGTSTQKSSLKE